MIFGLLRPSSDRLRQRTEQALRDVDARAQHLAAQGLPPDRGLIWATWRFLRAYNRAARVGAEPYECPWPHGR